MSLLGLSTLTVPAPEVPPVLHPPDLDTDPAAPTDGLCQLTVPELQAQIHLLAGALADRDLRDEQDRHGTRGTPEDCRRILAESVAYWRDLAVMPEHIDPDGVDRLRRIGRGEIGAR